MKNFRTILVHEFLHQIKSFKFYLIFVLTIIIATIFLILKNKEYSNQMQEYSNKVANYREEKANFKVYSEIKIPIFSEPTILSIFSQDYNLNSDIYISHDDLPEIKHNDSNVNIYLSIFDNIDMLKIIQYFFSIMIIFLVSDSISRDRDYGMMRLIFTNKVKIVEYFFAKYLGNLLTIVIPLSFLFIYIFVFISSMVNIEKILFSQIILLFISFLLYISIYILICLLASIRSKNSSISLLNCILIYMVLFLLYPNIINYITEYTSNLPTHEKLISTINNSYKELDDKIQKYENKFRDSDIKINFSTNFKSATNEGYSPTAFIVGTADRKAYYYLKDKVTFMIPELNKCINYLENVFDNYYQKKNRISNIREYLFCASPEYLLRYTTNKFCGFYKYEYKMRDEAKKQREIYLQYLRKKKAFTSFDFFTQVKENEFVDRHWQFAEDLQKKYNDFKSYPKLNLYDLPDFNNHIKPIPSFAFQFIIMLILNIMLLLVSLELMKNLKI